MKKLKAFTLTELLVGMVIGSIVIGTGYGGYLLIYKQYLSFKAVKKELVSAMRLHSVLDNDFANAEEINFDKDKNMLTLHYVSTPELNYKIMDSVILRTTRDVTDTFHLAVKNLYFASAMNEEALQTRMISRFSFDAKLEGETEHFIFTKDYSAEALMNAATAVSEQHDGRDQSQ